MINGGKIVGVAKTTAYVLVTRAYATNYTPSVTNSTIVTALFNFSYGTAQAPNVDILIGGVTMIKVQPSIITLTVGTLNTVTQNMSVTFVVPPNTVYRFNTTGTGTANITSVYESNII